MSTATLQKNQQNIWLNYNTKNNGKFLLLSSIDIDPENKSIIREEKQNSWTCTSTSLPIISSVSFQAFKLCRWLISLTLHWWDGWTNSGSIVWTEDILHENIVDDLLNGDENDNESRRWRRGGTFLMTDYVK